MKYEVIKCTEKKPGGEVIHPAADTKTAREFAKQAQKEYPEARIYLYHRRKSDGMPMYFNPDGTFAGT